MQNLLMAQPLMLRREKHARRVQVVERVQVRAFYHEALHTIHRLAPEIPLSELWLDRLPEGKWRYLTDPEVQALLS